jgi:hypothetical protein
MIEHVDVRSHDSLRGFEIGTQVEPVQDFGDRLRVKSGNFEFEVDRKLLTNVLNLGELEVTVERQPDT